MAIQQASQEARLCLRKGSPMQRTPTSKRFSIPTLLSSPSSKARGRKEREALEKASKVPLTTRNVEEFFGDRDAEGEEIVRSGKEKIEDWLRGLC
ncbi:MAG: hypothetical protein M1836_003193 [Candelina mexicana]|nr:MAG: hypothetical protein M1836_003193 [Candelina mexicana]